MSVHKISSLIFYREPGVHTRGLFSLWPVVPWCPFVAFSPLNGCANFLRKVSSEEEPRRLFGVHGRQIAEPDHEAAFCSADLGLLSFTVSALRAASVLSPDPDEAGSTDCDWPWSMAIKWSLRFSASWTSEAWETRIWSMLSARISKKSAAQQCLLSSLQQ